jgi:cysteine-rich repeat protein
MARRFLIVGLSSLLLLACDNGDKARCGDGTVDPGEECDDNNTADGDGCSAACLSETPDCPSDMVAVPADSDLGVDNPFCMDMYEASMQDATENGMGSDTSVAVSQPGVLPWHVNPISAAVVTGFDQACQGAGKRLCTKQEWFAGCTGTDQTTYAYGDTFDRDTCNSVDSFCEEFCQANPQIDPCDTADNCGYSHGSFHVAPTGHFPNCLNAFGALDVCGNVWEVVPSEDDPRGYEIRGGAYNCANPPQRHQCTFNAEWNSLYAGFRCCMDPNWITP